MRRDIKLSDGCKPAPSKPHCLHGKGSPRRKGGKLLHLPVGDFRTAGTPDPASDADRKAKAAMHFAYKCKEPGAGGSKSAWVEGGAHCFLAAISPSSHVLGELVTASTVGVVEHMVHIADELDRMGMIDMPDRRRRKEQNKYMVRALEAYSLDFFAIPVRLVLSWSQPDAGLADTLQLFHKAVKALPEDLSPRAILANRQPIAALLLDHVRDAADQADVIDFVASYDPFTSRSNALGQRQTARLGRRTRERLQALDLGTMAYDVALATLTVRTSPPGSPLGEAA